MKLLASSPKQSDLLNCKNVLLLFKREIKTSTVSVSNLIKTHLKGEKLDWHLLKTSLIGREENRQSQKERGRERESERWCHTLPPCHPRQWKNDLKPPWTQWSWISIKDKLSAALMGFGKGTKPELPVHIRRFNTHIEVWVSQSYDTLVLVTEMAS